MAESIRITIIMIQVPESKVNILVNIDKIVRDEMEKSNIPSDTSFVVVGTVDQDGIKIMAAVKLTSFNNKIDTKIKAIWEHDWNGNDSVGAKIIFAGK